MRLKLLSSAFAALLSLATGAEESVVRVVFLEPIEKIDASGAEIRNVMPRYRLATNQEPYGAWLKNESAERALRLYQQALNVAPPGASSNYYVALVPDGNHAAVGFRLERGGQVQDLPRQPYILLGPEAWRFETTLLHETGHMIMALLAGGKQLDGEEMASIPHSTAALSDRSTAFSEGWAIHLETLAAHLARSPALRRRYHRQAVTFSEVPWQAAEYFRHAVDLTSYSQNLARYAEVRDNNYAFETACQTPDYLRVQLEKARDFSTLRDADQLLQSEGFYASFFFLFLMRGNELPDEPTLTARQDKLLKSLGSMFAAVKAEPATPWLLRLVLEYMKLFPDERGPIVETLNDLSHGVFVDPGARQQWHEHYLAALHLDREHLNIQTIMAARTRWREQVLANPAILFSRVGPQLACTVPGCKITLPVFGEATPLRFDLNTAPRGMLRLIPGITEDEILRWEAERERQPFQSSEDFRRRVQLGSVSAANLKF